MKTKKNKKKQKKSLKNISGGIRPEVIHTRENRNPYSSFREELSAGHDTTAHTMTWLTYELARNPKYQRRVQQEVDAMFDGLNGQPMKYEDCKKLPFLTRFFWKREAFLTALDVLKKKIASKMVTF